MKKSLLLMFWLIPAILSAQSGLRSVTNTGVSYTVLASAPAPGAQVGMAEIRAPILASLWGQEGRSTAAGRGLLFSPQIQQQGSTSQTYPRLEQGKRRGLWRGAVLASAAVAATSAAVAHWSSGKGDDAYDRYLSSAGEKRREDAFDDAERYDRIAGAAFVAMEAGLVLTAYFVFF